MIERKLHLVSTETQHRAHVRNCELDAFKLQSPMVFQPKSDLVLEQGVPTETKERKKTYERVESLQCRFEVDIIPRLTEHASLCSISVIRVHARIISTRKRFRI